MRYRIVDMSGNVQSLHNSAQEADTALGDMQQVQYQCNDCEQWFYIFFLLHKQTCTNCNVKAGNK